MKLDLGVVNSAGEASNCSEPPPGLDAERLATATFFDCIGKALSLAIDAGHASDAERGAELPLTPFDSSSVPPMPVSRYIHRLGKHFGCSRACFVLALVLIDRVVSNCTGRVAVTARSAHRLYLASLMVAAKFWDDDFFLNAHYAKCGGVTLKEANRLEQFLLRCVRYELHLAPDVYSDYTRSLVALNRGPRLSSVPASLTLRTCWAPVDDAERDRVNGSS